MVTHPGKAGVGFSIDCKTEYNYNLVITREVIMSDEKEKFLLKVIEWAQKFNKDVMTLTQKELVEAFTYKF